MEVLVLKYLKNCRPGWERRVITLAQACTCHNKNTRAVCCMSKTYGVLPHLFLIHSFSALLITLFTVALIKRSICLYSTFYLLLFFHKVMFSFSCTC